MKYPKIEPIVISREGKNVPTTITSKTNTEQTVKETYFFRKPETPVLKSEFLTDKEIIDAMLALPIFHLYKRMNEEEIKAAMMLHVGNTYKDVLTEQEFLTFFGRDVEAFIWNFNYN